jgi:hypothetical protein
LPIHPLFSILASGCAVTCGGFSSGLRLRLCRRNFVTGTQTHFSFENLPTILYPEIGLCCEQAAAQRTVGIRKSPNRGRRDPAAWEGSN